MVRTRHAGCEQGVLFHQDITQNSKMKRDVVSDSDSASTEVVMNYKRRRGDLNSISNPKVDQVQPSPLHTRSRGLHLVLSDTDSDDEVKTYTSRSGRRIIHNKLFGDYDSRYYRKTRHSLRNHTPCVPQEQNESPEIIDDDDDDDAPLAKSTLNSKQARQPSSRSNSRRVTDGVHGKTSPDVPMMNGNISYLDDDSSIRRSTRQRKVVYDTLNQSWLLGTTTSGAAFRSENIACSSKPNYDDNEETSNVDMYSRVKQRHTKTGTLFQEKKESSSTDNEAETITEEQSSSEDNDNSNHSKYHLRPKKPLTNRFQISIDSRPRRLTSSSMFNHPPSSRSFSRTYHSPVHHSPMFKNRRHAAHNNSSTSSSSDDEMRFERRKSKSMARSRGRFLPMNLKNEDLAMGVIRDRVKIGSSLADVDPMEIDKTVTFEKVGGLAHHLNSLKEMILFPLLYPEVFEKFKISPPRGVLFYGPPGTGKTLVARALANECSQSDRKIAFFMRKGADCLSKWVGESERQLRLLFDQAYSMRPSIIFFDEIDGLAPVRSSRQDQIHSSIVSTLLALMDGLDNRGEVVIIGATNRIDTVDPALRRPGRFDREFNFPLPSLKARESIMEIHTKDWKPPLTSSFVSEIARKCVGYCGADVKALCAEATLIALRRRYPQIYSSKQKLVLDVSSIEIKERDFTKAMVKIVPAANRAVSSVGRALSPFIKPLMQRTLDEITAILLTIFPQGYKAQVTADLSINNPGLLSEESEEEADDLSRNHFNIDHVNTILRSPSKRTRSLSTCYRPRMIVCGNKNQGHSTHLAPALLHQLEGTSVHSLDLSTLYSVVTSTPEEACAKVFHEAKRNTPSIIYLPHVDQWWSTVSDAVIAIFNSLLDDISISSPILLLVTSNSPFRDLPDELQRLFSPFKQEVVNMSNPTASERKAFFVDLILIEPLKRPRKLRHIRPDVLEELPVAPPPEPRKLSESELRKLERKEENTLRELRLFLRDTINKLVRDRKFLMFAKPVDIEEVPDYPDVISHPMDLETMMQKIDLHKYESGKEFLEDVDLICHNALEYNPDKGPSDRLIRHRACALRDAAYSLIEEIDSEFEKMCEEAHENRLKRGGSPTKFAPKHYITKASASKTELMNKMQQCETVSDSEVNKTVSSSPNKKDSGSTTPRIIVHRRKRSPWFGSRTKFRTIKQKSDVEPNPDDVSQNNDSFSKNSHTTQECQSAKHSATPSPERIPLSNQTDEVVKTSKQTGDDNKDSSRKNEPDLVVNVEMLKKLLDDVVAQTRESAVESLEKLHSRLSLCIKKHETEWNKMELIEDMKREVERFKKQK